MCNWLIHYFEYRSKYYTEKKSVVESVRKNPNTKLFVETTLMQLTVAVYRKNRSWLFISNQCLQVTAKVMLVDNFAYHG